MVIRQIMFFILTALLMNSVKATGDAVLEFYDEVGCKGNVIYSFVHDEYLRNDPQTLPTFAAFSVKLVDTLTPFNGAAIWLYRFKGRLTAGDSYIIPSNSNSGDCFSNGNIGWVHFETTAYTGKRRSLDPELVPTLEPEPVPTPSNETRLMHRAAGKNPHGYITFHDTATYKIGLPTFSKVEGKPTLAIGLFRAAALAIFQGRGIVTGAAVDFLASLYGGTTVKWLAKLQVEVPKDILALTAERFVRDYREKWGDTVAQSVVYLLKDIDDNIWEEVGVLVMATAS